MKNKLFETTKINGISVKNRLIMPPMITMHGKDGKTTDFHMVHYGIRSDMGVGMIIVEATAVLPEGRITNADLGLYDDSQVQGLQRIVEYCHKNGTFMAIQIGHAGRKGHKDFELCAPSPVAFSDDYPVPKQLSIAEISNIVQSFRIAAMRAEKAGFDAIEIHAAHGYLLNQFLSPLTNKRKDSYGGNNENRERFLFEVITAIKEVVKIPIFVRISANEYAQDGNGIDYYVKLSQKLEKAGISLLDVSSGGVIPMEYDTFPRYQIPLSKAIKAVVNIPVTAVGLITSKSDVEIALTCVDYVQVGRELLRQPGLLLQFAKDENFQLDAPFPYNSERLK